MIIEYIKLFFTEAVKLFFDMAPYIMLGIGIAGVLHVILSKNFVAKHIGGNNISSVFKAALFGVPLPLCSCGVVPTAVYLKNSGASKASVSSFLISTPQTGVDSIAATWGMLGPLFAIFKALAALIIGMAGGIAEFILNRKERAISKDEDEKPEATTSTVSQYPGLWGKIKEIFNYAVFELLNDIVINFIIGLAIAAAISIAIPDNFFASSFLSNPIISMLIMVAIGIPMYICSTSSIPIAVALIAKGVSPGAAYVFLVAGPATNAASLAIISKALGKKATVRYLVTIIAGSLIFGFVMDIIYGRLGISPFGAAMVHNHEDAASNPFLFAVSIIFLGLLILLLGRRIRGRAGAKSDDCNCDNGQCRTKGTEEKRMTKIRIEGMSCSHCTASVEKALSTVSGINQIDVNLNGKYAMIDGDFKLEEAEAAIAGAGYEVVESSPR
ncbi:MAG: SO_0444 family Cu/Zn efflux transporter [Spirochaetales bacterium]|uniref:SO_0444 family Cu/Zn efflux transporter n=1 Tax=Candidatus Thalassospirochaeta sargassi TaxID=3119039 RepID=A0AAJ1MM77_9SPIO|nr:SO_0444 family Cu/Zn efflux transporter [Spirochaetales bacterium]